MGKIVFNPKTLLVALLASIAWTSCTDTLTLSGVDETYVKPDSGSTVTQVEETNFEAEFATDTAKLYTVRQYVECTLVTLKDDDVIKEEKLKKNLDLNALFDHPEVVYVENEKLLSDVKSIDESEGKASVERVDDGTFVRHVLSRDWYTTLNAGEKISAKTKYEKFVCQAGEAEKELCFTAIRDVFLKAAETPVLNKKLSNEDSTVYDVLLTYEVELNRKSLNKSADSLEKHYVPVAYRRVYKIGNHRVGEKVDTDNATRELLEKEDGSFVEKFTVPIYEEWSDGSLQNKREEVLEVPILFKAPKKAEVKTTNKDYTTTGNEMVNGAVTTRPEGDYWTIKTTSFTYSSTARNGDKNFDNVYTGESSAVTFKKGDIIIKFENGNWTFDELSSPVEGPYDVTVDGVTYDGYDYTNNIRWTYDVSADVHASGNGVISASAKAEALILLKKKELLKREARNVQHEIIDDTHDKFSWDDVETWTNGEEKCTHKEWIRLRHFNEPANKKVYTKDISFVIKSVGHKVVREEQSDVEGVEVTTRYATYTASVTSDTGEASFENVYSYDIQKGVYTSDDGQYKLEFGFPEFKVEEVGTEVSDTPVKVDDYDVWVHTHRINHTYIVKYNGLESTYPNQPAHAVTELYVLNIPKNLPPEWGEVQSFGVSAVPSDDVDGTYAKKAFCLVTDRGAVAVVTEMSRALPTLNEILTGYFVPGTFDASYNSAYFTTSKNAHGLEVKKWAPAVAMDKDGILYYYQGYAVRSVRRTDLAIWGWRNGNYSTKVGGYTVSKLNGELTIKTDKGEVLRLK